MKIKILYLTTLIIATSFCSCGKALVGSGLESEPINTFETFWHNIDVHYSLFPSKNQNWDSLYQVYRPKINSSISQEELWNIFSQMIQDLDDELISIREQEEDLLDNDSQDDCCVFDSSLVYNEYLENVEVIYNSLAEDIKMGVLAKIKNKNILYVGLSSCFINQYVIKNDNQIERLTLEEDLLNKILEHEALVLDYRSIEICYSGSVYSNLIELDKLLTTEETPAYSSQFKNGPEHNDFEDKLLFYTQTGLDSNEKIRPTIVLTKNTLFGQAEKSLLRIKTMEDKTIIGDTTSGNFSITHPRELPNNWYMEFPIQYVLLPDGSDPNGIGVIPDIYVKNTPEDINQGKDKVLDTAIQYLKDEYGID